jgi:acyl-CoA thioesterase FadM
MYKVQRTLITRSGELDARCHITPAVMARYHEYMRSQAFLAPELGLGALVDQGYTGVVRAQHLELIQPVVQNVELELSVHIGHVGRSSIAFAHSATRASDGAVASRSRTVMVLLGPDKKPASVPDNIRMLVQSGETPEALASPGEPPADAWAHTIQVRPSDLDSLQHVNQARYVDFFDDVRQLAQAAGAYGEQTEGDVKQISVEYLREAKLGRDLLALTWRLPSGALGFVLNDAVDGSPRARATIILAPTP